MKLMIVAVASIVMIVASGPALAQGRPQNAARTPLPSPEAKNRDIRRLLRITKAGQLGAQMMDQMFESIRNTSKQVPEDVWNELIEETKAELSPGKLIELNVPIYSSHYTHDEIKGLISFYQSPLGRKVIGKTPLIVKEAYDVGIEYGRQVMQRINEKLRTKGYKPHIGE